MAYWPSCALIGFILLLEFFDSGFPKPLDYSLDIERVENVAGDEETIVVYDWRVVRKGKDRLLSGIMNITQDLDNTFMRIIDSVHSARGTKYFSKTPFKLGPLPVCNFYNTSHKMFIEPNLIGKSDFPIIPPEGLCPIPKGSYYIKELEFHDLPTLPGHIEPGVWKVYDRYKKAGKVVGGINLIVRVQSTTV